MNILRRVLIGLATVVLLALIVTFWAFPVGLSVWMRCKAPKTTYVVPAKLTDSSVSQATGRRFRYFNYEFELPWSDLDGAQERKPNAVVLKFNSGLQVSAIALEPKEFINGVANSWFKMSPPEFEARSAKLGLYKTGSDYDFLNWLYTRTPGKLNLWSIFPSVHYREVTFLHIKDLALGERAASGMFYVANQDFQGFQEGSPEARPPEILVDLYREDGGFEFVFSQQNYRNTGGVSQVEINRVVQSLRRLKG